MKNQIILTPSQRHAAERLLSALPHGDVLTLEGDFGMGKSSVLRHVQGIAGGAIAAAREFMAALSAHHPRAIEEAAQAWIEASFERDGPIFVDDISLIEQVSESCDYPRSHLLAVALTAVVEHALARKRKLVFAHFGAAPDAIRCRAIAAKIGEFSPEDYEQICRHYLFAESAARLDFCQIHSFAPALNGHQLRNVCCWLRTEPELDTDRFTEYVVSQNLTSNVDIEEVEPVDWNELKGVDEVVSALEAKVALPFENAALSAELQLRPKRGVLLAGPPGTGKTTIGRSLAHRLKSKFFLIDGTMIAGSNNFHCEVNRVFDAAKRNAPAIVFIDDADVIFQGDEERGLYRYLLTKMDGLESASSGRVCVMLTAMDAASLPAALLRSGRVELWLETKLPDEAARREILKEKLDRLAAPLGAADLDLLSAASAGLTGADLKAVVEDAKLLYAHDRHRGGKIRPAGDYFLDAIETIRSNRRNYVKRKPLPWAEMKIGFQIGKDTTRKR